MHARTGRIYRQEQRGVVVTERQQRLARRAWNFDGVLVGFRRGAGRRHVIPRAWRWINCLSRAALFTSLSHPSVV
jgi:hypothetical protein